MPKQSEIGLKLNSLPKPAILFPSGERRLGGLKRGRMEIIAEILRFCDRRRSKTNIMYRTNLNYAQMRNNISCLLAKGLLVREMDKYVTTEKGYRFLLLFAEIQRILNYESV